MEVTLAGTADDTAMARMVLNVVTGLLTDIDPARARQPIDLDHSLTRDLGIGSLERVELLLRLEQAGGVQLSEAVMAGADTPRDLLRALSSSSAHVDLQREPQPIVERAGRAAPASTRTLTDVLRWHVDTTPDRVHVVLREEDGAERPITYGALWTEANEVAAGLRARGVVAGDRVALLLRTERAFFSGYMGTLAAGGVPVPLYPPFRADQIEEYAQRQAGILRNADARVMLTFAEAERVAGLLRPLVPSLCTVATTDAIRVPGAAVSIPAPDAERLALIQYTSGSTGSPKGVALSHANLLANIRAFGEALNIGPDDVGVTWLPLYHDMGLIGTWFGALYYGTPLVAMSPLAFLTRPVRWMQAFSTHRGTATAAPNFAYDLCARKITDEEMEGLDLSSWRCALNGAEAVLAGTIERFSKRFARYGFGAQVIKPVYGLAEASLCVTVPPLDRAPKIDTISREAFQRDRAIRPASVADPLPLTFVACGRPIRDHEVRIVDGEGRLAGDRTEGYVHVRGPSVMQGYFKNPEATAAVMRGEGWIDTGDLGYRSDGDLFITGRVKDVIIAGGRNVYPQEIEEGVTDVPGIRRGCVAAFGASDPDTGTERLVVVAETREQAPERRRALHAAVGARVVDLLGVPPDVVVLARPGSISKTSSGKIRRTATREAWQGGTLEHGRASAAWQWSRLIVRQLCWQVRRALAFVAHGALTTWIVLCVLVAIPATWVALILARDVRVARRRIGVTCRALLALGGCRVRVSGVVVPAGAHPAVLVANHASYLDVIVLLSILPPDVRFAAKARLFTYPILGGIIDRAGYLRVQRGSSSGADALTDTVRVGESLFVFPEGTFVAAPGVMPFRLGAFRAATETGRPVVPLALVGTRAIWPDETWIVRPGTVSVVAGEPMWPTATVWPEMVRLRDNARQWIAAQCGEPLGEGAPIIDDLRRPLGQG